MTELTSSQPTLNDNSPVVRARACQRCGAPVEPMDRFCGACGAEQPAAAELHEG